MINTPPLPDALSVVERRWFLRIVRELRGGPLRFNDLRQLLPGLSAKMLSQRLAEMIQLGLAVHARLTPVFRVHAYGLTAAGQELGSVLDALAIWEEHHFAGQAGG